jgi:DNA-binding HxlR family transcriptional regulator
MNNKNEEECNLEITIKIIGSKWNLMILYQLSHQTLRFNELQKGMNNVNPKTITKHLRYLEKYNIIKRVVYAEVPPKVEYSLTENGIALIPILKSISKWGSNLV